MNEWKRGSDSMKMSMYMIDAVNICIHALHFLSLKIETWIEFYRKVKISHRVNISWTQKILYEHNKHVS